MNARLLDVLRNYGLQLSVLVVAVIALRTTTPSFSGSAAVYSTMEGFALVGIVGLGLSVTMIARELDMSVASMATLAAVIAVRLGDLGLVPCVLIATVLGVGIGLLQGFFIARLGINSLVFTVGSLILLRGLAWIASGEKPIMLQNFAAADPLLLRWGIVSPSSVLAVALFVVVGAFLAFTRFGREIYATGGARVEAAAAGVPVRRSVVIAFAISGGCAALAGAITAVKGGSANPDGLNDVLLGSVAAVLIGGISLYGGRGTVLNVALGVAVVSAVSAGMVARGAQSYVAQLITGVLLVVVIAIEYMAGRVSGLRIRLKVAPAGAAKT